MILFFFLAQIQNQLVIKCMHLINRIKIKLGAVTLEVESSFPIVSVTHCTVLQCSFSILMMGISSKHLLYLSSLP